MKKFFTVIVACGLMAASCIHDQTPGEATGAMKLKVTAVNSIQTRGDIYSTGVDGPIPALGSVNVYTFLNDGSDNYLWTQTIDMSTDYHAETLSASRVLADNTFPAGNYRFLAVGRAASDGYTIASPTATTNFNDFTATIQQADNATNVIFAGYTTQEVFATGATIEIDIARKVAGIFTYLTDVPNEIGGTTVAYLRLRVSSANTAVNLTSAAGSIPIAGSYYAINIPLAGQTVDQANHIYTGPGDSADFNIVANSQIASNYALPIGGVTMTLELQDDQSNPLKTWSVVGPAGTTIDLTANVLLAIGIKNNPTSELGDDETAGGDGDNADDSPVSLLTDETITVNVMRDWDAVNNATLQEANQ